MPRIKINDGQEILFGDLNNIAAAIEKELLDRLGYELGNRQSDFVFQDSFLVSYVNSTTVSVRNGIGVQTDGTQVDPEPTKRLLYLGVTTNKTISTPDPTNPRIDLICIRANRATIATASRNFKDATSGVVSSVSMDIETDWAADLLVVAGTPAGSPSAPAVPAGYIKVAELTVAATTGMAGTASVADKRVRYKRPSSSKAVTTKTAAYTIDLDDEVVRGNTAGSAFAFVAPDATLCAGKILVIKNVGTAGNNLTLNFTGGQTADGASSQVIPDLSSLSIISNGTGWDLV